LLHSCHRLRLPHHILPTSPTDCDAAVATSRFAIGILPWQGVCWRSWHSPCFLPRMTSYVCCRRLAWCTWMRRSASSRPSSTKCSPCSCRTLHIVSGVLRSHDKKYDGVVWGRSVEVAYTATFFSTNAHDGGFRRVTGEGRQVFGNDVMVSTMFRRWWNGSAKSASSIRTTISRRRIRSSVLRWRYRCCRWLISVRHSTTLSLCLWMICLGRICCRNFFVTTKITLTYYVGNWLIQQLVLPHNQWILSYCIVCCYRFCKRSRFIKSTSTYCQWSTYTDAQANTRT